MRALDDRGVAPRRRDPPLTDASLKVLYFGTYDRAAPRNAQVISCLRGAGVEVVERHRQVWGVQNWSLGSRQMSRVLTRGARRSRGTRSARRTSSSSAIPGHFDLRAARRIARGRPIVFNPLVSLHDTLVGDRKRFRPWSPAARHAAARRPGRVPRRRPRRGGHGGARRVLPAGVRPPRADRVDVALVGAEEALFRPGLAAARAVPRALRREADPAPRARHDPRRGRPRPGDPVPGRRRRPARAAARRPSGERRARASGSRTRSSRPRTSAPAARSASSTRAPRRRA